MIASVRDHRISMAGMRDDGGSFYQKTCPRKKQQDIKMKAENLAVVKKEKAEERIQGILKFIFQIKSLLILNKI